MFVCFYGFTRHFCLNSDSQADRPSEHTLCFQAVNVQTYNITACSSTVCVPHNRQKTHTEHYINKTSGPALLAKPARHAARGWRSSTAWEASFRAKKTVTNHYKSFISYQLEVSLFQSDWNAALPHATVSSAAA